MERTWQRYFKIHTGPSRMEKIYFRVNHPIVPTLLFGAMAAGFIYLAQNYHGFPIPTLLGALAVGVFLWTLIEYSLHRFIFHYSPKTEPWRTLFSGLHLAHHRDTQDPGLIIAPPAVALLDSLVIFLILYLICGNWGLALLMLAGIDLGYIFYEWVHYGVHQFHWERGLLGYYKRYHFYHHFRQPQEGFGITVPIWDHVFRTQAHTD